MSEHPRDDEHDLGLEHDLGVLWNRRRMLGLFVGVGAAGALGACAGSTVGSSAGSDGASPPGVTSADATTSSAADGCVVEVPEETAGPYPGDGSNGPDVLRESGIVRQDLTRSFGSASGVAKGVPLTIEMTLRDPDTCEALEGAAVYLWHCDRSGSYSLYTGDAATENYLRGVQASDEEGVVRFMTIFPACYAGRWPHAHFEVYRSLDEATASGRILSTSQIAFPEAACRQVYSTSGYEQSVANLGQVSLSTDMVFADDGGVHQLATMSGNPARGYRARLTVGV